MKTRVRKMIISGSMIELFEKNIEQGQRHKPCQLPNCKDCPPRPQKSTPSGKPDPLLLAIKEKHRAQKNLERLAYANWDRHKQPTKFLTLTKKENWKIEEANPYFHKFIQRLSYSIHKDLQYIAVPENQKRGSIHYHMLVFNYPFVPQVYKRLREVWGGDRLELKVPRGSNDSKNVVAYLSKYLGKSFTEGSMLHRKKFYTSHGLIRPQVVLDDAAIEMLTWYLPPSPSFTSTYFEPFTFTEVNKKTYHLDKFATSHLQERYTQIALPFDTQNLEVLQ